MNANFRQKLKRKKNENYEHEKIRIFELGNPFEYSLEIRIFECSNIRSHPLSFHKRLLVLRLFSIFGDKVI